MRRHREACLERIVEVATLLGDLAEDVVFLGGAVAGLLVTDPASPAIRPTLDIDVLVEVATRGEYYKFQDRLRQRGFLEAVGETVICRFRHGSLMLDVMPTDPDILGFANRWYASAARDFRIMTVDSVTLRVVSPACFLATKLEAFHSRGNGDFMLSHDMEDIIVVIDGRPNIVADVSMAEPDVRSYLREQFALLIQDRFFLDALPAHLPGDVGSQQRLPILLGRVARLAGKVI